jgi:hypothetical protein
LTLPILTLATFAKKLLSKHSGIVNNILVTRKNFFAKGFLFNINFFDIPFDFVENGKMFEAIEGNQSQSSTGVCFN